MIQTYEYVKERIKKSKKEEYGDTYQVFKQKDNYISSGSFIITPDDKIRIVRKLIFEEWKLLTDLFGIPVVHIDTQNNLRSLNKSLPAEYPYMTPVEGKLYPVKVGNIYKYGVLQNPKPQKTITIETLKKLRREASKLCDSYFPTAVMMSKEVAETNYKSDDPFVKITAVSASSLHLGREPSDVRITMRKELLDYLIKQEPKTHTFVPTI